MTEMEKELLTAKEMLRCALNDYRTMLANLTATQARSSELKEALRHAVSVLHAVKTPETDNLVEALNKVLIGGV